MTIALPKGLPARDILRQETRFRDDSERPESHDAQTLNIALLNLMPEKQKTETQFARLLGGSGYHVDLTLLVPDTYQPKNTSHSYLEKFYRRWSEVRDKHFDGLIVTGAPVETLPFEQVDYWQELTEIMDWARYKVTRSFYVCWAAQAALYHYHEVPKYEMGQKRFGIFRHKAVDQTDRLLADIGDHFWVPVSRHTEVRRSDLSQITGLALLADATEAGPCLVADEGNRAHYMFNHLEYDAETLRDEYLRDLAAERPVNQPRNYFPFNDPQRPPVNFWHRSAQTLFRNWLSEIDRNRFRFIGEDPFFICDVKAPPRGSATRPERSYVRRAANATFRTHSLQV